MLHARNTFHESTWWGMKPWDVRRSHGSSENAQVPPPPGLGHEAGGVCWMQGVPNTSKLREAVAHGGSRWRNGVPRGERTSGAGALDMVGSGFALPGASGRLTMV